ncbi:MAG: non-canonical purine NTP pyrophosphatase [Polyangiales bacterium]
MHRLLLATRSTGKVREFRELLGNLPGVELVALDAVPGAPEVVEDGDSFEHNATKKALEIAAATDMLVLADDSGLEVDALGGAPGVRSARYAGERASDADNNAKLVAELVRSAAPEPAWTARYRVVLALADPSGPLGARVHLEHGACEGRIARGPAGSNGFSYDPYFVPDGYACTMAELASELKNRISHRALAARKLAAFLAEYLPARRRSAQQPSL